MRILILSDLHANPWALQAIEQDAGPLDYVLCAGDVVSYGPDPAGAIAWLREHDAITVRGNHDNAVGFNAHPRASPAKAHIAMALRDWTRAKLSEKDLGWLQRLPVRLTWELQDRRFALVHATPFDPLFDYRMTPQVSDEQLDAMLTGAQGDVVIAGHTHLPFTRRHRQCLVVNPGSAGQPLDGDPRAAYALWVDGQVSLHRVPYDQSPLLAAVGDMGLPTTAASDLTRIVQTARL
jgi:putative phosphoesterase